METRVQRVGGMLQKFPPAHRAAYLAREMQGLVRRPHQIRRYFANERDFAGLQIGAGHHHLDGWLTTDLEPLDLQTVYMDATKPLPFNEGMFDCIVAEHIIEHVTYESALDMLSECRRALKDRGVIRISTPDIRLTYQLMNPPLTPVLERYVSWSNRAFNNTQDPQSPTHVVNRLQHEWGHQFLYDADTLITALEQCGFTEVTKCTPNESSHSALRGIDRHAYEIGKEFNELESLIMEAIK
jgi:predicted SAM-dependent methyltransferase